MCLSYVLVLGACPLCECVCSSSELEAEHEAELQQSLVPFVVRDA